MIISNYNMLSVKDVENSLNNRTYTDYLYRLSLMAKSIFKWEGLPNGIDERWIERYLFTDGRCMFFKDEMLGYMVTKCSDGGIVNHYDEPTMLYPVATNYSTVKAYANDSKECVLIKNNDDMLPTAPTLQLFALRLAEISRTIDINVAAQKTPILIKTNEKQKNTMNLMYKKYEGNAPCIIVDKSLGDEDIKVFKTDAPVVFDKLQIQKHAIWNECMTFLGINNANQDKRERLVDDEVQANNEQVEQSAEIMLKNRQRAAEQISELIGHEVTVTMRNCKNNEETAKTETQEGGVTNE